MPIKRKRNFAIFVACEGNAEVAYVDFYSPEVRKKLPLPSSYSELKINIENINGCNNLQKIRRYIANNSYNVCLFITDKSSFPRIERKLHKLNQKLLRHNAPIVQPILSSPYCIEGLLLKCLKKYSESRIKDEENSKRLFKKEFGVDSEKISLQKLRKHIPLQPDFKNCPTINSGLKVIRSALIHR